MTLAAAILSVLAVLLPILLAGLVKRKIETRKAERDAALLNPDPTDLSRELDGLFRAAGGAPRLPPPETGDRVQPHEYDPH